MLINRTNNGPEFKTRAIREWLEAVKSREGLNKSPSVSRSREGGNLASYRIDAFTPILTFPRQVSRDLFRGSLEP